MNIYSLGISAFYHDSAAALLKDGIIVAAAQEERFSRVKQDSRFPSAAIRFCIDRAGIDIDDIDGIFYYEDPKQKFGRLMSTYASFGLSRLRKYLTPKSPKRSVQTLLVKTPQL